MALLFIALSLSLPIRQRSTELARYSFLCSKIGAATKGRGMYRALPAEVTPA